MMMMTETCETCRSLCTKRKNYRTADTKISQMCVGGGQREHHRAEVCRQGVDEDLEVVARFALN